MFNMRFFNIHRPWEDWLGMLTGLLIALSPWFAREQDLRVAVANAFIIGVLVFFLAQLEYVVLQRWEEVAEAALGIWLAMSPYLFGYAGEGTLRYWHSTLGGIVILLAALKLWQDWELSDEELAQHGQ
jgi:SPW repeat-containing protein